MSLLKKVERFFFIIFVEPPFRILRPIFFFNSNFLTTRPIFDLKVSLNRAYKDLIHFLLRVAL